MGEDPDNRRAQAVCGEVPRLTPAAPPAEGRNLSDRRQATEALCNSEETIRVLLNAAPTAAFMIDTQGMVLAVNRIAAMRLGLASEAVVGRPISEFSPPPVAELRRQKGIEAIRTGEPVFFEDTCEGRTFFTSVHPVCNEQGQVIQLAVHSRDITAEKTSEDERRKLTIQLQQAQKMEAIGTLAGGIAHDFNNLLMAIQGNVSLMLFETEPSHPQHRTLTNIEKLIRSGADLTSKLLGYARKGKYESRPLLLNELLQETAETFGRMRKDIRIEWNLAPDLKGIIADKGQVEQVLLNLFVNASDAMPGGGKLFLKTDTVTHREIPYKGYAIHPGLYVRLTVADTGVGIDKEIIDRIFDPFFTTKKMGGGTGLGLASAYGIVKSHNGYIDVVSEKGKGSTFSVYFPATDARPDAAAEKSGKPQEGFGTLLLVDDEAVVLEVTAAMIRRLGYTVITAHSGREAIESYTEHAARISAVILDMIMPEMGGGEVFDQLKRINPRVKVLLASGYSLQGQAREIMKRGCDGFLQKPFTLEDISVRLRSLLGGN
jgi:two-component system cell cycle sensor histidine kinase/response regulator CckA